MCEGLWQRLRGVPATFSTLGGAVKRVGLLQRAVHRPSCGCWRRLARYYKMVAVVQALFNCVLLLGVVGLRMASVSVKPVTVDPRMQTRPQIFLACLTPVYVARSER